MKTIHVALPEKNYSVHIEPGILSHLGAWVAKIWTPRQIAVISDSHVAPLYQEQVIAQLSGAGFHVTAYVVPAGEASKNWMETIRLYRKLMNDHFQRTDGILALGGGVVGDLAGFVASTYMRGLALIQIPTSLLAQVDSSVGGKTAIDLDTGKNLVGTFYQPDAVFIDPDLLATLPQRYLAEGYAEVVKMAALSGNGFWALMEQINRPEDILKHAEALIEQSVAFKAEVVIDDEKESGRRQILNFGHTIGHAIELLAQGKLAHGEAVSIGMVQLSGLFEKYRLSPPGTAAMLTSRLRAAGLPVASSLIGTADFYEKVKNDKKNRSGRLNLVYLQALGQPALYPIPGDQARLFFSGRMPEPKR
ncbi:3-dehydroquinate synthase [Sporolactobacillus vineae]|uniref:3-dehydroquinate synthase n=1 Tax=Sporolactobacillus vineae TaxID=444463 RepID=UPI00028938EA|nr:3-dehydroquinate synthase [Sporolactobacillus vineae]